MKYPVRDFLKSTFYSNHEINTKGKTDLGIYLDKTDKSKLGVVIEAKKPSNLVDMITTENINRKAMHEAILYYLRERIEENNSDIRNIIITNIYEWFIFDAHDFERIFYKSDLVKEYNKWKSGQKTSQNTPLFYKEIAETFIAGCDKEINTTYFDLRHYQKALGSTHSADEKKLTALYKVFSSVNLMKASFANDSNSLDRRFYNELLHIIGLEERKEGSKKTIRRNEKPDEGSLLENTIASLESSDKIHHVSDRERYGTTKNEQLFNVALELVITWINRILFLKLLEAQLIRYHRGNKAYKFLDTQHIKDFDELNELFFEVLARREDERKGYVKEKFSFIPYLNSALFEMKQDSLEDKTILISNLKGRFNLPVSNQTVLTTSGKKRIGEIPTLQYLFEFLDAYDFSTEGAEDIQEDNKTLINASVLGLIFEKINGYKDGSFFTPGFITMYMCRETIRRAVLQKFEEIKGWKCENLLQLKDYIEDRAEANTIVNSLKICDPAVGSGHFLVSALNEIITIKSELGILLYRNSNRIKNYSVEIANDELIITDKESEEIFEYRLNEKDRPMDYLQEMQEALFHEKQTLIENCLFGVDINPNSVNICRLRLWIELLKNAYYTVESGYSTLETLPNIDINIKCGNSLVSRFPLDADLSKALKTIKYNISTYRKCVVDYKNATSKADRRSLEVLIEQIKGDFRDEIGKSDPKYQRLMKVKGELVALTTQTQMFELSSEKKIEFDQKVNKLSVEQGKLDQEIAESKSNVIYKNAFEWRFEFPEVLDDEGNFIGFDVVIGNPPYMVLIKSNTGQCILDYISNSFTISEYNPNTYSLFFELGIIKLLKKNGFLSYIIPDSWLSGVYFKKFRNLFNEHDRIQLVNIKDRAFEVIVETVIVILKKASSEDHLILKEYVGDNSFKVYEGSLELGLNPFENQKLSLTNEIFKNAKKLKDYCIIYRGVETKDNSKWISPNNLGDVWRPILLGKDVRKYRCDYSGNYVKFIPKELKSNANINLYNRSKILMRRTGNTIIACSDYSKYIALKNLYLIIPHNPEHIPLILIQLNSKLMHFFHVSQKLGENKAFAQFAAHYVENFPCVIELEYIKDAVLLLNEVEQKVENEINNSEIANKIDRLVYQLYSLTETQISLVESIMASL